MTRTQANRVALMVILALLMLSLPHAHAQSGGGYDLTWNTIDCGGGSCEGGGYTLVGTLGQPDASTAMSGSGYILVGGFWGGAAAQYKIYVPLVLKS